MRVVFQQQPLQKSKRGACRLGLCRHASRQAVSGTRPRSRSWDWTWSKSCPFTPVDRAMLHGGRRRQGRCLLAWLQKTRRACCSLPSRFPYLQIWSAVMRAMPTNTVIWGIEPGFHILHAEELVPFR